MLALARSVGGGGRLSLTLTGRRWMGLCEYGRCSTLAKRQGAWTAWALQLPLFLIGLLRVPMVGAGVAPVNVCGCFDVRGHGQSSTRPVCLPVEFRQTRVTPVVRASVCLSGVSLNSTRGRGPAPIYPKDKDAVARRRVRHRAKASKQSRRRLGQFLPPQFAFRFGKPAGKDAHRQTDLTPSSAVW